MESRLKFYDARVHELSTCELVLDIELSSSGLNWPGVILEKVHHPIFIRKTFYAPYFALRWR